MGSIADAGDPVVVLPVDANTFAAWLEPEWPAMRRFAARLAPWPESEELLQDAVAAAWKHRQRFDPARGTARAWLLAIVADHDRRRRRRRALPTSSLKAEPAAPTDERDLDLERAIAGLSVRQRQALTLHYYLDLPVAEIAAVMDCREGTVKATLAAARSRLRERLEAIDDH